jgi:outer membrane protein OmpA-like peptidoglycan-associated protein
LVLVLAILLGIFVSISCSAQQFKRENARHFKARYKNQISTYANACSILDKKRTQKPRSPLFFSGRKSGHKSQAEAPISSPTTPSVAKVAPKPKPVTVAVKTPPSAEAIKEEKLEDKVLKENHLPAPTSAKHEQIRKKVSEHLKNKKDNEPLELAPLYFTFAQDEFSVVDMEPFLIAVEYALQGKIILIEGHTDNTGKNDYNVQLSIKRVQKIRELMQSMGVPDDHISVVGYGEEVSKHDNKTTEGRQLNRRVDFKAF